MLDKEELQMWPEEVIRLFEINPSRFVTCYEELLGAIQSDDYDVVIPARTGKFNNSGPIQKMTNTHNMQDNESPHAESLMQQVAVTIPPCYGWENPDASVVGNFPPCKQAAENLQQSEMRFRLAIEQAPFPIMIHREDGAVLALSRTWTEITGYALENIPTTAEWATKAYGEDKEQVLSEISALYSQAQRKTEGEYQVRCRDGRTRLWEFSSIGLGKLLDGHRIAISIAADVTERKQAEAAIIAHNQNLEDRVNERTSELRAKESQLRQLAIYDNDVREHERTRIAREIHDELGQLLTALRMDLVMLQTRFDQVPGFFDKTEETLVLIRNIVGVVRNLTSSLRPPALDSGIVGALDWLAEDFTRRTGIPCLFDRQTPDQNLEDSLATTLFRIAQESLTNVTRHAQASQVWISFTRSTGGLKLVVEDDGCGFDPLAAERAHKSFGLLGMRERSAALNGLLKIDSHPGKGTRVIIELPFPGLEPP